LVKSRITPKRFGYWGVAFFEFKIFFHRKKKDIGRKKMRFRSFAGIILPIVLLLFFRNGVNILKKNGTTLSLLCFFI
jgi:hypothetical protein